MPNEILGRLSRRLLREVAPLVRPRGREAFLASLPAGAAVLDVGCGNNSPARAKSVAPSIRYTGLDIGNYNQEAGSIEAADEYLLATPDAFASTIESMPSSYDAVVSSHNLEHCNEPERVLVAMCRALRSGGRLYLSFPSEASTNLPRRPRNTLNFYDDPTHMQPPHLAQTMLALEKGDMRTDFVAPRHRPALPLIAGALLEPVSWLTRRSMPFGTTWALYGFESVIWATKAGT